MSTPRLSQQKRSCGGMKRSCVWALPALVPQTRTWLHQRARLQRLGWRDSSATASCIDLDTTKAMATTCWRRPGSLCAQAAHCQLP